MNQPLYRCIANIVSALPRCNPEWMEKHLETLEQIEYNLLPSGSGFDNGVTVKTAESSKDRLVFHVPFHPMNEHGYYEPWIAFTVTVTPSLIHGILLDVSPEVEEYGRLSEYVGDTLYETLKRTVRADVVDGVTFYYFAERD